LLSQGLELARQLAKLPSAAVARFKRALIDGERAVLEAALHAEADACLACAKDPLTMQRIEQFLATKP